MRGCLALLACGLFASVASAQSGPADVPSFDGFTAWTIGAGLLVTFIPTLIAGLRGHNNTIPIFLLCLFCGWSGIGWLMALVWSFTSNTRARDRRLRR